MDKEFFNTILPQLCDADTSSHPEIWSKENPAQGHCAIVSVLAQEKFGGDIVRVSMVGTEYGSIGSHYFNVIDGKETDFTISQFKDNPYRDIRREKRTREEILSNPDTLRRYELLKDRFNSY